MVQVDRDPALQLNTDPTGLQQESELVVAIFRSALIVIAAFAPLAHGGLGSVRMAMSISLGIAIFYNIIVILLYLLRRPEHGQHPIRGQRVIMLMLDLALISFWNYLTWNTGLGQAGSPLYPFFYVIVIVSAFWYGVPGALLSAGVGSFLYLFAGVHQIGYDPFMLIDALYRQIIYAFLIAVLSGYLVDSQRHEREQMSQIRARFKETSALHGLLVPAQAPAVPGLEFAARWRTAFLEGAGDFYDVINLANGQVVITLADVAGKSGGGAQKLPLLKAAFQASAQVWRDPGEVLSQVNRIVYPQLQPDMFISACVIMIDRERRHLAYANAGQDPPVFVRQRTHATEQLVSGGLVLGVDDRATYPTEEIELEPGDTICLYTDGITEARNLQGEEFGAQNLEGRVQSAVAIGMPADDIANNIFDAVIRHIRKASQHDDMTLLVLRVNPETVPHVAPAREAPLEL